MPAPATKPLGGNKEGAVVDAGACDEAVGGDKEGVVMDAGACDEAEGATICSPVVLSSGVVGICTVHCNRSHGICNNL